MFIYRKEDTLSSELCEYFIQTFEQSDEKQPGVLYGPNGENSTGSKKSTDITFHPGYLTHPTWGPLLEKLIPILIKGKEDYVHRHSLSFSKLDPIDLSPMFNLQRYEPGEGFFGWHCERASLKYSSRVLVWMIYLNTVKDRGETEFLYQNHFEEPKQGKLIIWPSDWMFTHRGVSSPTESKYILTGWFNMLERPKE